MFPACPLLNAHTQCSLKLPNSAPVGFSAFTSSKVEISSFVRNFPDLCEMPSHSYFSHMSSKPRCCERLCKALTRRICSKCSKPLCKNCVPTHRKTCCDAADSKTLRDLTRVDQAEGYCQPAGAPKSVTWTAASIRLRLWIARGLHSLLEC